MSDFCAACDRRGYSRDHRGYMVDRFSQYVLCVHRQYTLPIGPAERGWHVRDARTNRVIAGPMPRAAAIDYVRSYCAAAYAEPTTGAAITTTAAHAAR